MLRAVFDAAPIAIAVLDRDLRYVEANEAYATAAGLERPDILGHTLAELFPTTGTLLERSLRQLLDTGEVSDASPVAEFPPREGEEMHWLVNRFAIPGPDGRIVGVASIVADVTSMKQAEDSLEELLTLEQEARLEVELARHELARIATTDPLTGLANRLAFSEHCSLALARADRNGTSVAVLYLDLNGFKSVNDTLGHAAGDELLCEVARRLEHHARATDVVARLGGDEFMLLLADLERDSAAVVAARVAERTAGTLEMTRGEIAVSAAIGVAVSPVDGTDEQGLLASADKRMYVVKQAGRAGRAA
jgi:diguanylate cyclase (GGDEF)-like protein/PAS domain S-box-containing protein